MKEMSLIIMTDKVSDLIIRCQDGIGGFCLKSTHDITAVLCSIMSYNMGYE